VTMGQGNPEATGKVPPRAGRSGVRPRCEPFPQAGHVLRAEPERGEFFHPPLLQPPTRLLAAWDAGSQATFVTRMSAAARGLGLGLGATDEPSMIHAPLLCCAAGPRRAALAGDKKGMIHEQ
jgi:hypothetical protein